MSANLKTVFQKAREDINFAKELFANPVAACENAGISLNKTEIKLIAEAMQEIRTHFFARLYTISQPPEVLGHFGCLYACG